MRGDNLPIDPFHTSSLGTPARRSNGLTWLSDADTRAVEYGGDMKFFAVVAVLGQLALAAIAVAVTLTGLTLLASLAYPPLLSFLR